MNGPVTASRERAATRGRDGRLYRWLTTTDHKRIGILYLVTGLVFFLVGGLEALVLRVQLARPDQTLLSPDAYNELFTLHGTTMIFFAAMPILIGFANYMVPLMIGARDMAFPRLNALSYWLLLGGGILVYAGLATQAGGARAGWFSYAPLSDRPYALGAGPDFWAMGLLLAGFGSVATGVNLIVTISTMRAPGMTWRRVPLFVWMTFVNAILIVFAMPSLNVALAMLLADRVLLAHFFTPSTGGSALLWQHLFWIFGHPEVYILILPAFGIMAEVFPVFSRRPLAGRMFVMASSVAIAVLSFAVWVHHMFAGGLGVTFTAFFSATSMLIAVPTGVKIFNFTATMWHGRVRLTTAMLFALGFLLEFTIGGLTGVMFAVVPVDLQLTDTYFVVAHFHYVLVGGTILAAFSGAYYWIPKILGRRLDERLGKIHFWSTVVGLNLTFFPQHFLGLLAMPRRVYTYPDLPWLADINMLTTLGAFLMALSTLVFLFNLLRARSRGAPAGPNPWGGWTLEWGTQSPPEPDAFEVPPVVESPYPLLDGPASARGAVSWAEAP